MKGALSGNFKKYKNGFGKMKMALIFAVL